MGFELMTSSLPRMRSTPELHRRFFERGRRIELPFPAWKAGIIAIIRTPLLEKSFDLLPLFVGKDGFEPPKASPADLQSVPFGHSGIPPCSIGAGGRTRTPDLLITNQLLYRLSYTSKCRDPQQK